MSMPPNITKVPEDATILAYTAGIIDGEGCIRGSCRLYRGCLCTVATVQVCMCSKVIIEWMHKHYGGSLYVLPKRPNRPDRFMWQITCASARPILVALLPYLMEKRAQAEVAIQLIDMLSTQGRRISPEETEVRKGLCLTMKQLKRPWEYEEKVG